MEDTYIIYGAGVVGRRIQRELTLLRINVLYFVEKDEKKIGQHIGIHKIISWDEFIRGKQDAQVIIGVGDDLIDEVIRQLKEYKINFCTWDNFMDRFSRKNSNRLAIWGWWQGENLGDNWIKKINEKCFPDAVFIDTEWIDIDNWGFVLIGGGGLFINSCIAPWNREIKVPFGAWGLAAEFKHHLSRAEELKNQAEFFFLRDKCSYNLMNIAGKPLESYDITFVDPLPWREIVCMNSVLLIWYIDDIVTNSLYDRYTYLENRPCSECYDYLTKKFEKVRVSSFHTGSSDILSVIGDSGIVVSSKFHGIVAAIQMGIPCIAIEVANKLRIIMDDVGLGKYCIAVDEVNRIPELIEELLNEKDEVREKQYTYREHAHYIMQKQYLEIKDVIEKFVKCM